MNTMYLQLYMSELLFHGTGHWESGRGMMRLRIGLVLPRRSLAATPDTTSCLTVANVPIHVLSSLDSFSTLTASFALQAQHPLPITLRPHSSIQSPSLPHAIFKV